MVHSERLCVAKTWVEAADWHCDSRNQENAKQCSHEAARQTQLGVHSWKNLWVKQHAEHRGGKQPVDHREVADPGPPNLRQLAHQPVQVER